MNREKEKRGQRGHEAEQQESAGHEELTVKALGSLPTPLAGHCQSPCHPELQLEKGIEGDACPLGCSVKAQSMGGKEIYKL